MATKVKTKTRVKTQTLTTVGLVVLGVAMAAAAGLLLFGSDGFKNWSRTTPGYLPGYMKAGYYGSQCVPGYKAGARTCEYRIPVRQPAGVQGYMTPGYNGRCVPGYRVDRQACTYRQ